MFCKPVYTYVINHHPECRADLVGPRLNRLVIKASDYDSGFCMRYLLDRMRLALNQTSFACDPPFCLLPNSCIYRNVPVLVTGPLYSEAPLVLKPPMQSGVTTHPLKKHTLGDLASSLIMEIAGYITWLIGVTYLLSNSPWASMSAIYEATTLAAHRCAPSSSKKKDAQS